MSGLPADVFVPVPTRWRYTVAGDVFVTAKGKLLTITESRRSGGTWAVNVAGYGLHYPDPDEYVSILIDVPTVDAATAVREQLGARLMERRSA